ncbi:hypothetical protein AKJ09_06733 [Labilithrix luteola]|uniref:Putative DNA-binding domain-containing protein n=1 Tax=Labilithrix luteola TaxID=1391654 RepID=A0A0K1Q3V2_9BACT|nr:DNA-binding domain-containing protein [Labilithrix luteola]AKV00070.1 hypothetical protein AKJ09_06733 [Labilithrix luteola]
MPRDDASPPGLRHTQDLFYALVTGAKGVVHEQRMQEPQLGELQSIIAADERLSAVERLDIYATMYFCRLRDVLREDYPKLRACLGDDAFDDLARAYLSACPPTRASVRDVSEKLPGFIEGSQRGPASAGLSELAALERALIEVFDGPDTRVLELERLRGMSAQDLVTLPLSFVPNHIVLRVDHDVDRLWRAIELGSAESAICEKQTTVLIWRKDLVSCFRAVDALEASALDLALAGETFGGVCAWLSEGRSVDEAARIAHEILGRWVTDALIASGR